MINIQAALDTGRGRGTLQIATLMRRGKTTNYISKAQKFYMLLVLRALIKLSADSWLPVISCQLIVSCQLVIFWKLMFARLYSVVGEAVD